MIKPKYVGLPSYWPVLTKAHTDEPMSDHDTVNISDTLTCLSKQLTIQ